MDQISLGIPESVGDNSLDGVKIRFPFSFRTAETTFDGTITIFATGGDVVSYELGSNIQPDKNEKLIRQFHEIALKEIAYRNENHTLTSRIDIKYRQ